MAAGFGHDWRRAVGPREMAACARLFDSFHCVAGESDAAIASATAAAGTDVLVDLAGLSAPNRRAVMALAPAPIGVTWLGFPGTTGARHARGGVSV